MKKLLAMLLAVVMVVSVFAGCQKADPTTTTGPNGATNPSNPADEIVFETFEGDFIYKDSVSVLASNWNPHTYQNADQAYPLDFTTSGLFTFMYNDYFHPVEGKEAFAGYVIVPDMAASMPVDVTEKVKADHPEFGIPESATSGFAYTIDLNDYLCFDDGTKINAQTYVESMKRMLDPKLLNYRAEDVYTGSLIIKGAKEYANQGRSVFTALGKTSGAFVQGGGDATTLYINVADFWGITAPDGSKYVSVTDETLIRDPAIEEGKPEDYVSGKYLWENYLAPGAYYEAYSGDYVGTMVFFEDGFEFKNVGIFASGEYQITVVLENALSGFYLYYNLGVLDLSLVNVEKYDSLLKEEDGVWTSTYNTSVETAVSYGPYKVSAYQTDKSMHFVRNDKWWGYTDGKHVYQDPEDGLYYNMYQTTEIDTQVVAESATVKMMFLKGQLMGYGLQAEDFETYRNSDYVYETPATTIFFLVLNGHMDAIKEREAAENFDKATTDIETITLQSFRQAMAITYDKDLFCSTVSPARSATYAAIGNLYVYDVDTGARYRDTDQAKQILCDVYSVDTSKYANLDDAVESITGYDPETAKKLYQQAYTEALEKGYITDANNDGISDQTVTMTYSLPADSDFMTTTINYLNEKLADVLVGTGFEGKVQIIKSAPLGDEEWSEKLKAGQTDCCLCGWQGSALDPFSLTDLYTNPAKAYDAAWFDATTVELTLTVNVGGVDKTEMKEVTMTMKQWSDALNGATVEVDGVAYNFGDGQTDVDTRLAILAGVEGEILKTYNYLPMMQNASMALLSQQVYYVVEEYSPVMGRGGIAYMKYNYNEAEWKAFVESQENGELKY